MKKHLGSTAAIIVGILFVLFGPAQPSTYLLTGPIIVVGALAYRSSKKRYLGEVKDSAVRRLIEMVGLVAIFATVTVQNDFPKVIIIDPIGNVVIPLWILIAYLIITLKK